MPVKRIVIYDDKGNRVEEQDIKLNHWYRWESSDEPEEPDQPTITYSPAIPLEKEKL